MSLLRLFLFLSLPACFTFKRFVLGVLVTMCHICETEQGGKRGLRKKTTNQSKTYSE